MASISKVLVVSLGVVTTVIAHSHVNNLVIDGVYWQGYDPTSYPYETDPPIVVGWTAGDTDNGFVAPDAYQTGDIICHKNATPAGGHATVNAGDSVSIQCVSPSPVKPHDASSLLTTNPRWAVVWPDSHHGPVLDYLAACNGDCETVDKTTLEWFKIDEVGYLNGSNPGVWATDVLIADASTWLVQIPASLAPGNYVLRTEIIALHSAGSEDGAQNYPQCFNLAVSGTGTLVPSGTLGTDLYSETDPGILYNIYVETESYTIPGPTLYSGFTSSVAQSSSVATATSSAVVPSGASASASATSSAALSSSTSKTTAVSSTTVQSTGTTTITSQASTSTAATTSAGSGSGQTEFGQCGGSGWTGQTACAQGTCTTLNAYYAQCI